MARLSIKKSSAMTFEDMFRANAELTIRTLGPVSGIESFGYNARTVIWL
jgi:hypothetical protein